MKSRHELVATVGFDRIEAVVDAGGNPLVHDGYTYRDPERACALARAMLRAAHRAKRMTKT
jgi:hypothetical protein